MAFFAPEDFLFDKVKFIMRKDFADVNNVETCWIERGDSNAVNYYISKYMDTRVKNKRADTPAFLIINKIPDNFIPR